MEVTNVPSVEKSTIEPFVGLRPFDIDDSGWFFGRNEQSYDMLRRLNATHFLAVVGPSGCGKSSLVRAGLLASLRDGYLAGDGDWTIVTLEPKNDPIEEWTINLGPHLLPDKKTGSLLKDPVHALDTSKGPMVILIDQFEDLFKFGKRTGRTSEVNDFIDAMLSTAAEDAHIFTIVTMRSEFIEQCALYPKLAEAMNEGLYLLPRMDREQLRKAIVGPLRKAGGGITVEFLERLLDDGREDDGLPILQHALARLWPTRKRWEPMGMELYPKDGGLGGYIDQHADDVYLNQIGSNQKTAELLFRAITELAAGGRALRRPLTADQVMEETGVSDRASLELVIQAFQEQGFLRQVSTARGSNELIDLTHEAVARQWNRFGVGSTREECWIVKEDRERRAADKLREAAADYWRATAGKKSYLITGFRLDQLKTSLGGRVRRLDDREKQFLVKCESTSFWDRVLSRNMLLAIVAVVLVIGGLIINSLEQVNAVREKAAEAALKAAQEQGAANAKVAQLSKDASVAQTAASAAQTEVLLSKAPGRAARSKSPTLYPEIWQPQQSQIIDQLRQPLAALGITVTAPETVSVGPATDELRYFFKDDLTRANAIAAVLQKAGVSVGTPKHVGGFEHKINPGHFELWFKNPAKE